MQLQEKHAELRIFFFEVANENIVSLRGQGNTEWWPQWLRDVTSLVVHDSLRSYLVSNRVIAAELVEKHG
jgi:hypothetical protein